MCNQRKKVLSNALTPNTPACLLCCWCEKERVNPPNQYPPWPTANQKAPCLTRVGDLAVLVGGWAGLGVGFRSSPSISQGPYGHPLQGTAVNVCLFWNSHVYRCDVTDGRVHTQTQHKHTASFQNAYGLCSLCPSFSTAHKHVYTRMQSGDGTQNLESYLLCKYVFFPGYRLEITPNFSDAFWAELTRF